MQKVIHLILREMAKISKFYCILQVPVSFLPLHRESRWLALI